MALTPGTRLGPYEIVSPIGAGGMGEVYRATDTKLKRQVAIKILPPSVAADHDRLARFQREAEVLASLNHPNIAGIYGLEEGNDITALVMELVEGEDLSTIIARGPIPVTDALPIARQIADALEAAHEQGIVHRDLKPANIKVRVDGTVKVLDFGLAKAMDPAGASSTSASALANSPTMTSPAMTQMGMILGTAAYMSPEQAKGRAVDKRADIWAFGVVVYEMLTGRRLFEAEDISETLAAVLTRDVSLTAMPEAVPPRLRTLIRDCLIRDPKQRLRDIGDARLVLDRIIAGAPDDAVVPTTASTAVAPTWHRLLPWAVAGALGVVALLLWAPWRSETPADRPLVRLDVDLGADAPFPPVGNGSSVAISPDGTRLVYVAGSPVRLFTRRLDQPKATELPGTQGAGRPFFSPDGQWVGFAVGATFKKISVDGGAVVPLGTLDGNFAGASWAEDGAIFVGVSGAKGLLQFPAAGGAPQVVAKSANVTLANPKLLPGGKAILFSAGLAGTGVDTVAIEVMTLADGHRKTLVRGGASPHFLPSSDGTGHLLYVNKATLFAIPFDLDTLETRGTAVPVLDDVAYSAVTGGGQFAVSRTGTLIYRRSTGVAAAMTTVQWLDAAGKKEPLRATPGAYESLRLSPDGTRIALVIDDGSNRDVWVHDARRDATTRLTFGGINEVPAWSPDGQYIVFSKVTQGIFQARADGASTPQALMGSRVDLYPRSFTPDGKRLSYRRAEGIAQIWTVPLDDQGGQLKPGTPERFLTSTFSDQDPSFSPDGRWLAYSSNESGRREVYVRAFPPPSSGQGGPSTSLSAGKWQISNSGGANPHWSRTGRELVYESGNQLMTVSYAVNGTAFVADKPRVWIAALGGTDWDLAPDGKRVAVLIPEGTAQAPRAEHVIVMLQNFADELRRKVPVKK